MEIRGAHVEIAGVEYELASRAARLLGQFLDGIVYGVIIAASLFAGRIVGVGSDALGGVVSMIGMVVALAYLLFQDGMAGGQSLGKRWINTRVIDARTGAPCSYGQSVVRNALLVLLEVIDWIFILGERRQRLGDRAAHTVVVNGRVPGDA